MNLQNFQITAGEDRTLSLTARSSTGAILNLTGATIAWRLVYERNPVIVLEKTGSIVSASLGTFTISLTDDDTDGLKDGLYTFDTFVTISGTTTNAARGRIIISGASLLTASL